MKRKVFCFLMLIAFICCLVGCSSPKNEKEDVTLIVKCPVLAMKSVADADVVDAAYFLEHAGAAFAAQYEDANVSFDVRVFDFVDEEEAITGSFDTEQAMDILYEDYFNMAAYIHTGRVVPLDDMITDDMRADISDASWELSSVNGKTYMMPFLSRQNILMYNKELFGSCGLDGYVSDAGDIQDWSVEDWSTILDTLAQKLPPNVYPMMMYAKNNQGDTHIMSLIRAFGSGIYDAEGNFDFEDPKALQALAWIKDGVEKGWYPPHAGNLEITDNQELFNNGQLAIYVYNNANALLYDDLDAYGFVNFPGNVATSFVTGFEVFDNQDETKVKVAKDFIKYIYEHEEWLDLSASSIPESKKTAEKYADQITMLSQFSNNSSNVVDFMNSSPNWQGTDTSVRSVFYPHIRDLLMGTVTPEQCAAGLDSDCNRALEIGRERSTLHE